MERTILHVDMNNFYANVECRHHPEWQGEAIAVVGDAEKRHGIVLAKSEAAKRFGVKTGEPLWQARSKCPEILFVPPHFDLYQKYSVLAKEIYANYTERVESFGLDECWLDVTNSPHFGGNGVMIADEIRRRIREELGLSASVGVSFNKIFAKLGSDMKKPDATTHISRENFKEKVWPLPVGELLFVGSATRKRLQMHGIETIGDLALAEQEMLRRNMGKNGGMLWEYANGNDDSPVAKLEEEREVKSIGNSTTTPHDLATEEEIKITLYVLCESVAARLREQNLLCSTVQITLRDSLLHTIDRQGKLDYESCVSGVLFDKAWSLYRTSGFTRRPLRLIGVRACELSHGGAEQLSLFADHTKTKRQEQEERAIDKIREKFGHFSVQRGIMMMDTELSGINPKERHKKPADSFFKE